MKKAVSYTHLDVYKRQLLHMQNLTGLGDDVADVMGDHDDRCLLYTSRCV